MVIRVDGCSDGAMGGHLYVREANWATIYSNNHGVLLCVQEVVTPIYIMSYYIKWVTTSWTYGTPWTFRICLGNILFL